MCNSYCKMLAYCSKCHYPIKIMLRANDGAEAIMFSIITIPFRTLYSIIGGETRLSCVDRFNKMYVLHTYYRVFHTFRRKGTIKFLITKYGTKIFLYTREIRSMPSGCYFRFHQGLVIPYPYGQSSTIVRLSYGYPTVILRFCLLFDCCRYAV